MYKDLLPIGSVVALQGATRKLLIIGTIVHDEQTNTTYDYIGEPFPEGISMRKRCSCSSMRILIRFIFWATSTQRCRAIRQA